MRQEGMFGSNSKACVVALTLFFCSFLALASDVVPAFADQEPVVQASRSGHGG